MVQVGKQQSNGVTRLWSVMLQVRRLWGLILVRRIMQVDVGCGGQ